MEMAGPDGVPVRVKQFPRKTDFKSVLSLMLSLCPGCHAGPSREAVLSAMPPLLVELWREQLSKGHEEAQLAFTNNMPSAKAVPLFREESAAGY